MVKKQQGFEMGMETCQKIPPPPNPSTPRVLKRQRANFAKSVLN